MRRLVPVAAVLALVVAASTVPASGSGGPRYILVHGGGLPAPILLDDLAGNELLVSAPRIEPRGWVPREADRPVYDLALFFIVPDLNGRSPVDLRPDETGATGRFFPGVGNLEPIFELGAVPGIGPRRSGGMTPPMLDYLSARGVPVVSNVELGPEPTPTPTPLAAPAAPSAAARGGAPRWALLLAGGLSAVVALAAFVALRRPRRRKRRITF